MPARGTIAGIGFTVSILIADLAFHGHELDEAKVGVLSAALLAAHAHLARRLRDERLPAAAADPGAAGRAPNLHRRPRRAGRPRARPHPRPARRARHGARVRRLRVSVLRPGGAGPARAAARARRRRATSGAICRSTTSTRTPSSRPRRRRRPRSRARSGRCTTCCSRTRTRCGCRDLVGYAGQLGLDVERFEEDLRTRAGAGAHRARTSTRADSRGVSGTPTFFVNGLRHYGAYDIATLSAAVKAARARELVRRHRLGRPASATSPRTVFGSRGKRHSSSLPSASVVRAADAIVTPQIAQTVGRSSLSLVGSWLQAGDQVTIMPSRPVMAFARTPPRSAVEPLLTHVRHADDWLCRRAHARGTASLKRGSGSRQ